MKHLFKAKIYYNSLSELMKARKALYYNRKSKEGEFDNIYNVDLSYFDEEQKSGNYIEIALYKKGKYYIWKEILKK